MAVRCILICAGEGFRWGNHLGVRKHFAPVDGTPVIDTTIAALADAGISNVYLLGNDDTLRRKGVTYFDAGDPEFEPSRNHKIAVTAPLWNMRGQTVLLFGDVLFSKTTLNAALSPVGEEVRFIGRLLPSSFTGCDHKEIFGLAFGVQAQADILAAVKRLGSDKAMGWHLYDDLRIRLRPDHSSKVMFVHVDDATEDFDYPHDHERWTERSMQKFQRFDVHDEPVKTEARKWKRRAWQIVATASTIAFWLGIAIGVGNG